MSFIAQLETVGGLAHWAVYVALHLPDTPPATAARVGHSGHSMRSAVVKSLLAAHAREWERETSVLSFLTEQLKVPGEWVAEARALWAKRSRHDEGRWVGGYVHACVCVLGGGHFGLMRASLKCWC
jgi:hypothetical protein